MYNNTTCYGVDRRGRGLEPSTISFFFWLQSAFCPGQSRPANCREAISSLAHHPALTNGVVSPSHSHQKWHGMGWVWGASDIN